MARRRVTHSGKNSDGDITALCKPADWWSPRQKANAISDIESKEHSYYVQDTVGNQSDVRVVDGPSGKYLRTTADPSSANNLDNLPDC